MSESPQKPSSPCALRNFKRSTQLTTWPATPQADSGLLASSNAGWRSLWPAITLEGCNSCGLCLLYCPEGSLVWSSERQPVVEGDWCKGCGLCAKECPKNLIEMRPEEGR